VPLAIRWGGACPGRTITDFISFIDLAPTFLTLAGIEPPAEMAGRAFVDLLRSRSEGRIDPTRDCVITGRERHGYSRPWMAGYPIRSIVTDDYLYLRNFEPDRWPLGNPEIYRDCDDSPSKSYLMEHREEEAERFALCFGLRPPEELYRRSEDIACIHNLADDPEHQAVREALRARLEQVLPANRRTRVAVRVRPLYPSETSRPPGGFPEDRPKPSADPLHPGRRDVRLRPPQPTRPRTPRKPSKVTIGTSHGPDLGHPRGAEHCA